MVAKTHFQSVSGSNLYQGPTWTSGRVTRRAPRCLHTHGPCVTVPFPYLFISIFISKKDIDSI